MAELPVSNGHNGTDRDPLTGHFAAGNQAARGKSNPAARRVKRLRAEFMRSVTPQDIREVVEALVREAKSGNVAAMREFFNRCLGQAEAVDVIERLEELEALLDGASVGDRAF